MVITTQHIQILVMRVDRIPQKRISVQTGLQRGAIYNKVKDLEKKIGETLFDRQGRPTPRAQQLVTPELRRRVREIESLHRQNERSLLSNLKAEPGKPLVVMPRSIAVNHTSEYILSRQYPQHLNGTTHLQHAGSIEAIRLLRNDDVDLAFVTHEVIEGHVGNEFRSLRWRNHDYGLVTHKETKLFGNGSYTWDMLPGLPTAHLSASVMMQRLQAEAREHEVDIRLGNYFATLQAIAGYVTNVPGAIGFLPAVYECKNLEHIDCADGNIQQTIVVLGRRSKVEQFEQFLCDIGCDPNEDEDPG